MRIRNLRSQFGDFMSALRCYPPPKGMQCGAGTRVMFPRRISGADHVTVGARTEIGGNALIAAIKEYAGVLYEPRVEIGDDVYIGPNLYLVCASSVTIGDGAVLSEHVFIADVSHGMSPEMGPIMRQQLGHGRPVHIGEHSFIGYRASIMPGVKIGRHCIIGANSVVTKSIPDYCLAVGHPAKVMKRYDFQQEDWISCREDMPGGPRGERA